MLWQAESSRSKKSGRKGRETLEAPPLPATNKIVAESHCGRRMPEK
jgi:hypothetical protein